MNWRKRSRPIARATRYQIELPVIAPALAAAITPPRPSGPSAARIPATGRITSDGIGGKIVSSSISANTAG